MPEFSDLHRQETYKSLITISVEGFKYLAAANGGAAIALLAYLGSIAAKGAPPPSVAAAMSAFVAGVVFCGLAFIASYFTQLRLYGESIGLHKKELHPRWLWSAAACCLVSLALFALGCGLAVHALG